MRKLNKLKPGDKIAILSPSSAAPGKWPYVYELGLQRLREIFKLEPVEFPTTRKIGASKEERACDLIAAFESEEIKGIITSIGGDDQVTYIKNLPISPFVDNPKPFFGFSDNTHFMNFLWLNDIPSYYGGALFTQFAMQKRMDEYTIRYLKMALFQGGEVKLEPSDIYNDVGLNWSDDSTLNQGRIYESNSGWVWSGAGKVEGITWGGCLESIDEMLRHDVRIPSLENFESIILIAETSEEIPSSDYVFRVFRALGERGILSRVRGVLIGRPKAWEFDKPYNTKEKETYKREQRKVIEEIVRIYNPFIPIVQNFDFGHTDPQIPMPYGSSVRIDTEQKAIFVAF